MYRSSFLRFGSFNDDSVGFVLFCFVCCLSIIAMAYGSVPVTPAVYHDHTTTTTVVLVLSYFTLF